MIKRLFEIIDLMFDTWSEDTLYSNEAIEKLRKEIKELREKCM